MRVWATPKVDTPDQPLAWRTLVALTLFTTEKRQTIKQGRAIPHREFWWLALSELFLWASLNGSSICFAHTHDISKGLSETLAQKIAERDQCAFSIRTLFIHASHTTRTGLPEPAGHGRIPERTNRATHASSHVGDWRFRTFGSFQRRGQSDKLCHSNQGQLDHGRRRRIMTRDWGRKHDEHSDLLEPVERDRLGPAENMSRSPCFKFELHGHMNPALSQTKLSLCKM